MAALSSSRATGSNRKQINKKHGRHRAEARKEGSKEGRTWYWTFFNFLSHASILRRVSTNLGLRSKAGGYSGGWGSVQADKDRQGQRKLFPGAQTGGVAHDPLVWCGHLFVCLIWARMVWRDPVQLEVSQPRVHMHIGLYILLLYVLW